MKKQDISKYISLLAVPAALVLAGLWLLFNPATAARSIGWGVLFLLGIVCIGAIVLRPGDTPKKIISAIVFFTLGGWFMRSPMGSMLYGSRVVGLLVVLRGIQRLRRGDKQAWCVAEILLGVLLIVFPFTVRPVLQLIGLAMILAGGIMGYERLRRNRLDSGDDDPNIIDAL